MSLKPLFYLFTFLQCHDRTPRWKLETKMSLIKPVKCPDDDTNGTVHRQFFQDSLQKFKSAVNTGIDSLLQDYNDQNKTETQW